MHQTGNPDEVVELLRHSFSSALVGTIAIDGNDGVGKTTLATALQARVGGTVLSLDDFVSENEGGYIQHLKIEDLKASLERARRPCIVEGVCVLAVLEQVAVHPALRLYVKRVDKDGYWHDEDTCEPSEPVNDLIARRAREVAALDRFQRRLSGEPPSEDDPRGLTRLREEIIRYHANHRPSRRAEIAFLRSEDD